MVDLNELDSLIILKKSLDRKKLLRSYFSKIFKQNEKYYEYHKSKYYLKIL